MVKQTLHAQDLCKDAEQKNMSMNKMRVVVFLRGSILVRKLVDPQRSCVRAACFLARSKINDHC